MPRTHRHFQEGTPSRTDISLIGLGGCFRLNGDIICNGLLFAKLKLTVSRPVVEKAFHG